MSPVCSVLFCVASMITPLMVNGSAHGREGKDDIEDFLCHDLGGLVKSPDLIRLVIARSYLSGVSYRPCWIRRLIRWMRSVDDL